MLALHPFLALQICERGPWLCVMQLCLVMWSNFDSGAQTKSKYILADALDNSNHIHPLPRPYSNLNSCAVVFWFLFSRKEWEYFHNTLLHEMVSIFLCISYFFEMVFEDGNSGVFEYLQFMFRSSV